MPPALVWTASSGRSADGLELCWLIDIIRLIAPTTDDKRLPIVLEGSSGFRLLRQHYRHHWHAQRHIEHLAGQFRASARPPICPSRATSACAPRSRPRRCFAHRRCRRRGIRVDRYTRQPPRRTRACRNLMRCQWCWTRCAPSRKGVQDTKVHVNWLTEFIPRSGRCSPGARCRTICGTSARPASR